MSRAIILIAVLLIPSLPGANSFTAEGSDLEPVHNYGWEGNREGLINDGSFEWGNCLSQYTAWECDSDNGCDWIDDLTRFGLENYDGIHIAWLGGYCNTIAACYTSFCQEIYFDAPLLTWWWMVFAGDEVMEVHVKVDDDVVFTFSPQISDHLLGYQMHEAEVSAYIDGTHMLCFGMDNTVGCEENLGDNYFFDFVELQAPTAVGTPGYAPLSLSATKSLYRSE